MNPAASLVTGASRVGHARLRGPHGRMAAAATIVVAGVLLLVGRGPSGAEPRPGLWVVGADGTGAFVLVEAEGVEPSAPNWSPDGQAIAYSGAEPGVPENDLENEVLVTRIDGGDPVNLTAGIGGNCIGHDWSPDGLRVAVLCFVPGGAFQLWSVAADGTNPTMLAEAGPAGGLAFPDVVWEPGGNRIAFVATGPLGFDLFVVGSDGTGLRNLTADGAFDRSPAWSPDGSAIAFISGGRGGGDVTIVGADGTGRRALTTGGSSGGVTWQPGGDRLLFADLSTNEPSHRGLWTINADGTGLTRLIERGGSPDWSPEGDRIAYAADGVRVVRADGSGERRVAEGTRIVGIAWSPDGTRLAFDQHAPWD